MNWHLFFLEHRRASLFALFSAIFVCIALLVFVVWSFFGGNGGQPANPSNPFSQPLPEKNSNGYFVIAGKRNAQPVQVETKDFLAGRPALNPDGDRHLLDSEGYSIDYINSFRQFFINFGVVPNDELRQRAEADLLDLLGITASDACVLDIIESVPYVYGSQYAGVNFGFSSCPTGQAIPQ